MKAFANLRDMLSAGRPNLDEDRWLLRLVALFPLFFIAGALAMKMLLPGLNRFLIKEDGLVESATALGFLLAGGIALLLALRLHRDRRSLLALLHMGLAIGMVFAMLEEISWGQRILNLEPSEYFVENSTKAEINVHNLKQFPLWIAFLAVGFYGAFSRLLVPPALRRRFPLEVELLTPRLAVSAYFFMTFAIHTYMEYVYHTIMRPMGIVIRRDYGWEDHLIIGKDQEVLELLLAMGFLIFILDNWQRYKAHRLASTAEESAAPLRQMNLGATGR